MALRWGIVSAGKISHDFVTGLSTLPIDEHTVVGIAARDKERAEEFAKLHEIPNAFGNYEELAKSSNVDVIYIGALNPQHFEIGMLMLKHGKHILIEKPLSYQYVRKQIASGVLGTIEEVKVSIGFDLMAIDRSQKKELGGGTVLGLGIYVIQLSQWAFQEPPMVIKATGELNTNGVDLSIDCELQYSGRRVAIIQTSARKQLDNKAIIKGSKGQITLPNFWCPTSIIDIDEKQKEWVLPKGKQKTNFPNSEGLRYEAEEVRKCILEGKLQSEHMSHNESLLVAHIEAAIRKEVGVVYPEDVQNT